MYDRGFRYKSVTPKIAPQAPGVGSPTEESPQVGATNIPPPSDNKLNFHALVAAHVEL